MTPGRVKQYRLVPARGRRAGFFLALPRIIIYKDPSVFLSVHKISWTARPGLDPGRPVGFRGVAGEKKAQSH